MPHADPSVERVIVTFFRGATDAEPSPIDTTWPDFANALKSWSEERAEVDCAPCPGKTCAAKLGGLAFSPCRYAEGATRGKASVLDVHAFAGDLDHLTRDQVAAVREALEGTAHALYSTHNHLREGKDDACLRVVIPLSRPVPAADWRRFWLAFAEISGLPLDKVVKSTASLLFMPSRPRGAEHVMIIAEGEPLDVDAVLEHAAPPESVPAPSPRAALPEDHAVTELDGKARDTLISLGKLARTLAPGGAYGPQGLGRRMTLYNTGRLIGGLAAAGRVPLDEALALVEHLCDPPLTPGGECEKALRDGAAVGGEAPLLADPGPGIVAEARGKPDPSVRYALEPWTWSQLEAVCRGAPDDARPIAPPRPTARETPSEPGDGADPEGDSGFDNLSRVRERQTRANLLRFVKRSEKTDEIVNCGGNVSLLLRHLFYGQFRFNMLSKSVETTSRVFLKETPDTLPKAIADWLTFETDIELAASPSMVADALLLIGMENAYNPLEEYLRGLVWDGVPRLDTWLETYARAVTEDGEGGDVSGYVRTVGARWLIAAAARALYPGCKVDTALVLEGLKQGERKSTIFDTLGGDWFSDTPLAIGQKDASQAAGSAWIIELAELASLRRAESEAQKAFLSSRVDYFRLPYGRTVQRFKRACVFAGTTNVDDYLTDRTGNRRFWCVRVGGRGDVEALRRDRDQLWAEAVHRLHTSSRPELCRGAEHPQGPGERWWLEPDEQETANGVALERMGEDRADSVTEKLAGWLAKPTTAGGPTEALLAAGLTTGQVAEVVLDEPAARHTRAILTEVGSALRALGFKPRGRVKRRYFRTEP